MTASAHPPSAPPSAASGDGAPAPSETPRSSATAWHLIFGLLLAEKGSPDFTVESEVPLLAAPPRADFLLLRRKRLGRRTRPGRTLRHLWAWIEDIALVELKTAGRPLRAGDVERWLGLALAFQGLRRARGAPGDVQPVLVVPKTTPTLRSGLAGLGLTLRAERAGYWAVVGGHSALRAKVLVLEAIADAERDELLGLFAGRTLEGRASRRWLSEHGREVLSTMGKRDPEYASLVEALVEFVPPERLLRSVSPKRRLEGLTPEQRLEGLAPEQRLAGLAPKQRLAGLAPEQRLAGLAPEQRLAGLAPEQRLAGLAPKQRLEGLAPKQRLAGLAPEQRLAGLAPKQRLAGLTPEQRLAGLAPEQLACAVARMPLAARRALEIALAEASNGRRSRPRTAPARTTPRKARPTR